jgi:hypothetical protein
LKGNYKERRNRLDKYNRKNYVVKIGNGIANRGSTDVKFTKDGIMMMMMMMILDLTWVSVM